MPFATGLFSEPFRSPVRWASLAYLAHLLCLGWIGSAQAFLALSLIFAAVAIWRGELPIPIEPVYFAMALFVAASLVSASLSPGPYHAFLDVGEAFGFLAFPLALSLYRRIDDLSFTAHRVFVALTIFLSLYGIAQYTFLFARRDLEHRISGPTGHVMTFSGILLPLALYTLAMSVRRRSPWTLLACLLSTGTLVLTFTRGAWIGWMVGFFVLLLLRRPRWSVVAAAIVVLSIAFSPMPVFARLISSFDVRQSSNLDRIRMVQAGLEIIKDHPILGVGPANIKEVYPLYRLRDAPRFKIPHLHNNIVQIWAERGGIALLAYLLLVIMLLRRFLLLSREVGTRTVGAAGAAITTALASAGLFEYNFGDSEVLHTSFAMFALLLSKEAMDSRSPQDQPPAGGPPTLQPQLIQPAPEPFVHASVE